MTDYCLPAGYESQEPCHYLSFESETVWQPDVYPLAADIATRLGASTLIDVGCSRAEKLIPLGDRFTLVGIDLEDQLPQKGRGRWLAHDLSGPDALPVTDYVLRQSVLICADVIEHMDKPEVLVAALRDALDHAVALVLSTPDRDLIPAAFCNPMGPPWNPCHAREWTAWELETWLLEMDMPVVRILHQRSNTATTELATTVVVMSHQRDFMFDA